MSMKQTGGTMEQFLEEHPEIAAVIAQVGDGPAKDITLEQVGIIYNQWVKSHLTYVVDKQWWARKISCSLTATGRIMCVHREVSIVNQDEIFELLCDVIEGLPGKPDPICCISAAKALLATLISVYQDGTGEEILELTIEALRKEVVIASEE